MVQRLLLDRVDAEAARTTVRGQDHAVALAAAYEAQAALAVLQLAVARANVALQPPARKRMPVAAGDAVDNVGKRLFRLTSTHANVCTGGVTMGD